MLPNPWEHFVKTHAIGDIIEGIVTSVVDFGAFVKVTDNIEGLIHVSQMNGSHSVSPYDQLQPGDTVLARITSIEPDRERLGQQYHGSGMDSSMRINSGCEKSFCQYPELPKS